MHLKIARFKVKTVKRVLKLKKKGKPIPKGVAQEICKFLDFNEPWAAEFAELSVRILKFYEPPIEIDNIEETKETTNQPTYDRVFPSTKPDFALIRSLDDYTVTKLGV